MEPIIVKTINEFVNHKWSDSLSDIIEKSKLKTLLSETLLFYPNPTSSIFNIEIDNSNIE